MNLQGSFWDYLDRLAAFHAVVIDRPAGSYHPRFPDRCYPLDYGYFEGTSAIDGGGIDVWLGSLANRQVTGMICTVDLNKHDAEIKVLLGCSEADVQLALDFLNSGPMRAQFIPRPALI